MYRMYKCGGGQDVREAPFAVAQARGQHVLALACAAVNDAHLSLWCKDAAVIFNVTEPSQGSVIVDVENLRIRGIHQRSQGALGL